MAAKVILFIGTLIFIIITIAHSDSDQKKKTSDTKTRDTKYQLSTGAISIGGSPKIREKRQQDYGRNPPSTSNEYNNNQQPQIQPSQSFSPLQQRPQQNTFQNNVPSPSRNTVVSQQSQQAPAPQQRIRQYQKQQQRPAPQTFQPQQQQENGYPPSTAPASPRRPNGRRGNQQQQAPPPRKDPAEAVVNGEGKATRYYYPPRMPLPLPVCFYNPTGYVCCNKQLNDLIVDTYTELEARPKFHTCNINAIATQLQKNAESRFNTSFETIAGFEDFAQKIHFNGDLACKVEIGGKYMMAYGTVKDAEALLAPEDETVGPQNEVPRHHISKRHSAYF